MALKKIFKDSSFYYLVNLLAFVRSSLKKRLIIAFILMLISSLAEVVSISSAAPLLTSLSLTGNAYEDSFVSNLLKLLNISTPEQILIFSALIFSISAIFSAFFRIISLNFNLRLSSALGSELSSNVFSSVINQSYLYHLKTNSAEIISNNTLFISLVVVSYTQFLQLAHSSIISLGIFIFLLNINAKAIITLFALLLISYLITATLFRKKLYSLGQKAGKLAESQIKYNQESIKSIRDIILDSKQNLLIKNFNKLDVPMRTFQAKAQLLGLVPRYVIESLSLIFVAILALYLINQTNGQTIFIATIGTILIGLQKLLPSLQQVYGAWASIKSYKHALERIFKTLKKNFIPLNLIDKKTSLKNIDTHSIQIFNSKISLENVAFQYEKGNPIIKNFNLSISKGEIIGLKGKSGSGKSTICDIIMTLIEPTHGSFLIDDKNIHKPKNKKRIALWRSKIAHVPQDIFLIDASIKENILFSKDKDNYDREWFWNVIDLACLSEFIKTNNNGVDTIVGEGGSLLSGGQKQRIGLARAIYKKSPFLILDEATSALDKLTERKILNNLKSFSRDTTILLVSHNESVFEICDRVIEFNK